jgi:NAD(P)H-hydrate epimerase
VAFNRTGNPGMTVTSTGDVLAVTIGAMYCKNRAYEAACCGAFLAGAAGDLAFMKKGFGIMATDVVEKIPNVLKRYHPAYESQASLNRPF